MRIFNEEQRFNQWWLYVILVCIVIFHGVWLYELEWQEKSALSLIALSLLPAAILVICGAIVISKLSTHIDQTGIEVKFSPFGFTRKKFLWSDIERAYVRTYHPISEYGGWGIRGLSGRKAYNVSGNQGIQLFLKGNKSFLIGTREPHNAQQVLKSYTQKK